MKAICKCLIQESHCLDFKWLEHVAVVGKVPGLNPTQVKTEKLCLLVSQREMDYSWGRSKVEKETIGHRLSYAIA